MIQAKMKKLSSVFLDIILRVLHIKPIIQLLKKHKAIMILLLVCLLFGFVEWLKTFSLQEIIEYKKSLLYLAQDHPLALSLFFFLFYFFASALSLPGTTFFNIIGGFLFGFVQGTLLSIFAISLGSSISFLLVRFFLRDLFIRKGGVKLKKIYENLKNDEIYYLFALRMFPFTPLFFTNLIMGLSSIKLNVFYAISFISLLPGIAIYANMGSQLSQLENLQGLLAPNLLFAFSLIALFPVFIRYLIKFSKKFKRSNEDLSLESDNPLLG